MDGADIKTLLFVFGTPESSSLPGAKTTKEVRFPHAKAHGYCFDTHLLPSGL